MDLPGGQRLAFVDVPGHERFVPNMLAGLGPVPAVMMVVAADGGWMPQSAEHLAAIDALGISRGLLGVTRADLADPGPAAAPRRRRDRRHEPGCGAGRRGQCRYSTAPGSGSARKWTVAARLTSCAPASAWKRPPTQSAQR